jgi:hypothetical protein
MPMESMEETLLETRMETPRQELSDLWKAILKGDDDETVERLLKEQGNSIFDDVDSHGRNILHQCCARHFNLVQYVRWIMEYCEPTPRQLFQCNLNGNSVISIAIHCGHKEICKILIPELKEDEDDMETIRRRVEEMRQTIYKF